MTDPNQAGKPRRLAGPERRRQLLEAARVAYAARGLAATGKDIAAVAGINEALIYRHFESKERLLAEAAAEKLEQVVNEALARERNLPPYEEGGSDEMRRFISRLLGLLLDATPILGVVLFSEQGPSFYQERIAPALDALSSALAADPDPAAWNLRDYQPQAVITLLFGMCFGVALDAWFRGTQVDIHEAAGEIAALTFEGLLPHPGARVPG